MASRSIPTSTARSDRSSSQSIKLLVSDADGHRTGESDSMRFLVWLGLHRAGRRVLFALVILLVAWINPPTVVAIAMIVVLGFPLGFLRFWSLHMRDRLGDRRGDRSPL